MRKITRQPFRWKIHEFEAKENPLLTSCPFFVLRLRDLRSFVFVLFLCVRRVFSVRGARFYLLPCPCCQARRNTHWCFDRNVYTQKTGISIVCQKTVGLVTWLGGRAHAGRNTTLLKFNDRNYITVRIASG